MGKLIASICLIGFLNAGYIHAQSFIGSTVQRDVTALLGENKLEGAEAKLNAYLKEHKKDIDALLLLGQIYETMGGVGNRRRAELVYNRALDLQHDRTDITNALGRVKTNQTLYYQAVPYFQRTLIYDPLNEEAITSLLNLYVILENHDAIDKLKYKTIDIAERHPDDVNLKLLVGRTYYELNELDSADVWLCAGLKLEPENFKIHKALSDINLGKGFDDRASEHYLLFLRNAQSSRELKDACFHMEIVLPNDERDYFRQLPDSEKGAYIEEYWRKRDPYGISLENERLMDHLQRIAYAEQNYSCGLPGRPYDDRGRIYLRYGKPDDWYIEPMSGGLTLGNESWVYHRSGPDMFFDFVDQGGYYREVMDLSEALLKHVDDLEMAGGDFEENHLSLLYKKRTHLGLPYAMMHIAARESGVAAAVDNMLFADNITHEKSDVWMSKLQTKSAPPTYEEYTLDFEKLDFDVYPVQFRTGNGQTKLLFVYGIPVEQFWDVSEEGSIDSLFFLNDQVLFDHENKRILQRQIPLRQPLVAIHRNPEEGIISEFTYKMSPGDYTFAFQLFEQKTERGDYREIPLHIRSFTADSLQISDVLLAHKIEHVTAVNGMTDVAVKPNPFSSYRKGSPVSIYFEVYNLFLDTDNQSRFTITLKIDQEMESGNFLTGSLRTVSRFLMGGDVQSVESVYERTESSQEAYEYLTLNLSDLEAGLTRLTITVADKVSQRTVSNTVEFNIN